MKELLVSKKLALGAVILLGLPACFFFGADRFLIVQVQGPSGLEISNAEVYFDDLSHYIERFLDFYEKKSRVLDLKDFNRFFKLYIELNK